MDIPSVRKAAKDFAFRRDRRVPVAVRNITLPLTSGQMASIS
jgi:hypothetical protein